VSDDPYGPKSNQAHPMTDADRRREWYAWEKARNEARRHTAIAIGCLIVLSAFAVVGMFAVIGWLGWG
jgi:hypothetical protein